MAEQPEQQPPPASRLTPEQRAALIAAALGIATTAALAAVATAPFKAAAVILAALTRLFVRFGYRRETIRYAIRLTTRITPPTPGPGPGPAENANTQAARTFAAWFLERSTARVEAAYDAGAKLGDPEDREEQYVQQHLDAQARRREAARKVDAEARKPDQVTDAERVILRWRAHPDDKVTPECRAADGAWFYADTPPIIGYPGMPHGGTCRCWSANAGSLAEVARGRSVNEAVRSIVAAEPDHRPHPAALPAAAATA